MKTIKQINQRIKEIQLKGGKASNEEIKELVDLSSELTLKTFFNFK